MLTAGGTYTFKVRGVYNSSNKGSWEESDSWYVSATEAAAIANGTGTKTGSSAGAWLLDSVGWWYCNADRSYTVNNWQLIDNKWYYFNEVGYMKTGWLEYKGQWYYLDPENGVMQTNRTIDGYQLDSSGVRI